ncbi:TonB-dependent receptor [Pelagicoccus sp. NFK12]|uniref:TonB-dependent receptor n=1 Tax=Pelagicoccus enzymogenes TaxID=2773457 RepID=A0A927F4N1_9BACT|nr:TonB-dependent receptor [Pelagicoccus enzymogenes]MBD5778072.1 TonB-dependent receptor [Pelagicoccus enzymogenes]
MKQTEKYPYAPRLLARNAAIVALVSAVPLSLGWAQDNEEDDEVFTLSPFEVNADEDQGYRANSTLAGSRINTQLKDVAASISVVTEDFIEDVGAADLNDILVYTANTESTLNYTNAGGNGTQDFVSDNPNIQNRVRGLGSAELTRDFFRSIGGSVGIDAYNLERVTVNRGPNSILYGMADPAGVVNYATKSALVAEDSTELSLRVGSNTDFRTTADFNRVLIDDKLAVRVLGLWADRGYQQQPAYYHDNRLNLATTYKPFENSTFKLNYEVARQEQNNPNSITPIDYVSEWVEQGRPAWNAAEQLYSESPDYLTRPQNVGAVAITDYDGNTVQFLTGGNDRWFTGVVQQRGDADNFTSVAFSDNKIAPFHDMNLNPSLRNHDFEALTFTWDQKLAENLYLNVGYLSEDYEEDTQRFTWGFQIWVDNNSHFMDGTPNPHFGETYVPQRTLDSKSIRNVDNEMLRGTLTYELDFRERNKWLGRHNFTALAERQETGNTNTVFNEIRSELVDYLPTNNRVNEDLWQMTRIRYLGGTADSPATMAPGVPDLTPSGVPNLYWDADAGMWATDSYSSMFTPKRRDVQAETVESTGFIWQSYWLEGKVVGTAGWRDDTQEKATNSYTALGDDGLLILGDSAGDPAESGGPTTTMGVVVHPLDWLSLHYNESENFRPAATQVNMFNESVPPPTGEGVDYGFGLNLLEGKMNLRVNWYEVEQTNNRLPWGPAMRLAQWELLFIDQNVMADVAALEGVSYTPVSPLSVGDINIVTTSEMTSKGMEIEMIYNPTENWRFMANVSQQDAVSSAIAPAVTRFLEEALPYWQNVGGGSVWNSDFTYSTWGFEGNPSEFYDAFPAFSAATYNAAEGTTNPQLREWRANAITNYTFTDGGMKGWNIGGALRWQDDAAIGFPTINNEAGDVIGLELNSPYMDEATLDVDFWIGFDKKIMNDRVDLNVQLNVRNLTRNEGFQAINANSDGQESGFRIEFGPTWTLQSTFSF